MLFFYPPGLSYFHVLKVRQGENQTSMALSIWVKIRSLSSA